VPPLKRKAFAYVTHLHPVSGNRLLVFSHPNAPEAGIQVPAGTIRPGESPEAAALREAHEETGLTDLEMVGFLGEQTFDLAAFGRGEVHQRIFFHLRHLGDPPELWRHHEPDPDTGGDDRPLFQLFWASLPDGVPALIADHGVMLPVLLDRLHAA
jgi:8-oxo-dGTP diphosphatase